MRLRAIILLSIYIVFEAIYYLFGDASNNIWSVSYFLNQSILIIGVLSLMRGYFDTLLIDMVVGLNVVKLGYNIIFAINENLAKKINSFWLLGLLIVVIIVSLLINKCRKK